MSRVTLTVRRKADLPALPIDARAIRPDILCQQTIKQISDTPVRAGNYKLVLGDLFSIRVPSSGEQAGDSSAQTRLTVRPGNLQLDWLGAGMQSGQLKIIGNAGAFVGAQMRGGHLLVEGDALALAGSAMRGGHLQIKGNAGERAGGVKPGHQFGMRGGVLQIDGNCGPRAGDRMRRGLIIIGGDSARQCAHRMLAGTMIVCGQANMDNGFELRHGSLILTQEPVRMLSTFARTGEHTLLFLRLLAKSVKPYHRSLAGKLATKQPCTRYAGDLASGGRGEILVLHS